MQGNPIINMIKREDFPELDEIQIQHQITLRENYIKTLEIPMIKKVVQQEIDELKNKAWEGKEVPQE